MPDAFGRVVNLTAGGLNLAISALDIDFKVTKARGGTLNKCEVLIFNLNESSRGKASEAEKQKFELKVGYETDALFTLFKGTIREAPNEHRPPDWVTFIRSGDGDPAMRQKVRKSYAAGTPYSKMLEDAAAAMGIDIGNLKKIIDSGFTLKDGVDKVLKATAMNGNAWRLLRQLAKAAGYEVSIQNEELQAVTIGQGLQGTKTILDKGSGLIGTPTVGAQGVVRFRSLILPDLLPDYVVELKSRAASGEYVITRGQYNGSNYSDTWYADLEAKKR